MTKRTKEMLYVEYHTMVLRIAWDVSKKFGLEFDECVSEANLGFLNALSRYNRQKGNVGTWIYAVVWGRLNRLARVHLRKRKDWDEWKWKMNEEGEWVQHEEGIERTYTQFIHMWDELSEDARTIVDLVFSNKRKIWAVALYKGGTPRDIRSSVRHYLKRHQGWNRERITDGFSEIRMALAN